MKLKDYGIMWVQDSEVYVADKCLYNSAEEFLKSTLSHIHELIENHSEAECGWFIEPIYSEYLPRVTTAYMRHAFPLDDEPEWWMEYEAGKGRRKVWCIDFSLLK